MNEEKRTTEVERTETPTHERESVVVREDTTVSSNTLVRRAIWYIIGFINILLLLRIVLLLLAANQENGFVSFIYTVSELFAMPFYGIFSYTPAYGSSVFEVSSAFAIFIYLLIGWGITKLLTLGASRR